MSTGKTFSEFNKRQGAYVTRIRAISPSHIYKYVCCVHAPHNVWYFNLPERGTNSTFRLPYSPLRICLFYQACNLLSDVIRLFELLPSTMFCQKLCESDDLRFFISINFMSCFRASNVQDIILLRNTCIYIVTLNNFGF